MDTQELCGSDKGRGHNQTTASGKPFWCADPRPEDVRIEDIAAHLSRECRFGGALRPMLAHGSAVPLCPLEIYSVAQHSVLVCDNVADPNLKLAALLHDAAEAYCKDIPKPLKVALTVDYFGKTRAAVEAYLAGLGVEHPGLVFQDLAAMFPEYTRIEARIADAIFARFGLDPGLAHHHEIAEADYRAVLTEKRDLLPPCPEVDWGTSRAEPFPERIVPLLPSAASALFLQRFRELYKGE